MRELTEIKRTGSLVDALLADHGLFHLEADLRWIEHDRAPGWTRCGRTVRP